MTNTVTFIAGVAFAAALGTIVSGRALAAGPPEDEAFQRQIFNHVLDKNSAHACFTRIYDKPHLASHPQQNVRTMTLLVTGRAEDEAQPTYSLGLGVTFRRTGTHFETGGSCGTIHDAAANGAKANVVNCGVDCDGGSIDVTLKDGKTVLVSIPDGARIWKAGSDDDAEPGTERKRFGSDDKLFRLDRAPLTDCLSLQADDDEKAAMKRGQ